MQLESLVSASPLPCPICRAKSPLLGVVDFHKSCLEIENKRLALSGVPVYYRQCTECKFVFTEAFDDWSSDDFKRYIYNDQYALIDPAYAEKRPAENSVFINRILSSIKERVRLIDYGGGSGVMAEILRGQGFKAETFDPFSGFEKRPEGQADIVTAFEVLEHSTKPIETMRDMVSMLAPEGILLFSTTLQPSDFEQVGLNWWYR
jgi:2-polyprenyl-6-hydroxyphenyl methylase/3-demethylubiquinone-9 3-methyltransferase